MRRQIRFNQVFGTDVRVYLRGGDACMPKQLLHGTHVGTALDKMRGERMAQRMRMQRLVDVRTFPRNPDDLPTVSTIFVRAC